LARRRKKRTASMKAGLKYELYGIVILILSVIALSREGSVARSLTYLFRFLIGTWDFVIPLFFIYIGLYVMMKREWPPLGTARKSGLLLILLGLVLMSHMSLFSQIDPQKNLTAGAILQQSWDSMIEALEPTVFGNQLLSHQVGGGMVGALLYSGLFLLFDNLGAMLIQTALFAIGILLVTGISYVELAGKVRRFFTVFGRETGKKLGWLRPKRKRSAKTRLPGPVREQAPDYLSSPGEPEEEAMEEPPPEGKNKKPLIFQLLQSSRKRPDSDGVIEAEVHPVHPAVAQETPPWEEERPVVSPLPVIHDFRDNLEPGKPAEEGSKAIQEGETTGELPEELFVSDKPVLPYQLPSFHLLQKPAGNGKNGTGSDDRANVRKLESTLESFGVRARVLAVVRGPSVTRYEIQPDVGVKVSKIVGLTDDIALALAAKDIRMEAPIPGKSAIGIEVPNTEVSIVTLREVMETSAFHESSSKLTIALGRDISGKPIVGNLARMPHLLVAGATGSGKSVCINGIITSILFKAKPSEVKFLMIDPKMVELNVYNGIPHLLAPVVTDPRRASLALKKVVVEMEKRYELFSKSGTRNIEGYNNMLLEKNEGEPLPFIVVIVDELADLMMVAANDVEDAICRLAQMARAAGIHLIIATQRPSVDVITGVIKANIPSRIAFGVSSQVDSRTILDMAGAEKLLGRGDMLYLPMGASKPVRVQGAFLSDQEVESVVHFCSSQEKVQYREELVPEVEETAEAPEEFTDELYDQAVQIVLEAKQASVSLLQRRMRVGYTRAARLIDAMEAKGVVGPYEGSKPREVRMTMDQYQQNRISS